MIEEGNCVLSSECKYPGACGIDIYMLPGYREEDMEFDHTKKFTKAWDSDYNRLFKCYLPYDKCKHNPYCIEKFLHKEVAKHSGDKQMGLVGLCFGGTVAQVYASEHPEKVKKLALIQTTDMTRTKSLLNKKLKLKDMHIARQVDYEKIYNNVKADTFIHNCILDRLIGGNPPKIKGAEIQEDLFCIHGQVPKSIGKKTMRFINKS